MEGAEALSPEDTDQSAVFQGQSSVPRVTPSGGVRPKPSTQRPKILNKKRQDRTHPEDWSERCVDVFDILAQIGEGTYGQVYKARAKDKICKCFSTVYHSYVFKNL